MKKVFLIHGWDGNPNNAWFPWVREQLEKDGYQVESLAMPNPSSPDVIDWPLFLEHSIPEPDLDTYLIGHSIGCQTIMRYLEALPENSKIGGVVFVAPYFDLPFLKTQEEKDLWKRWVEILIDTDKVKNKTNNFVSIFSDDDPDVDYVAETPKFANLLNSKIILEHSKGHFSDDAGVKALPSVVEAIYSF